MKPLALKLFGSSLLILSLLATSFAQAQTWTDPATRLMWASRDNGSDIDWAAANTYCSGVSL